MSKLPYSELRVIELSKTLSGRLAGLLFADQGAEVFIVRSHDFKPDDQDDYFDRNKISVPPEALTDTTSADLIIVDGNTSIDRLPAQVVLHITAALPGDEIYGELVADCSEDLLNALIGFFTNMSILGKMIGRPVIYTPLPLCSVYAGVNGAIAVAAALVDRRRCGKGREVTSSRLAGGLSAIGALALTSKGEPEHLKPADLTGLPEGLDLETAKKLLQEAAVDPARQLWLEQRLIPLNAPYRTSDNRFAMSIVGINRRLARRFLTTLGLWDEALQMGLVDENPYDPANLQYRGCNLADAGSIGFKLNVWLADKIAAVMATQTARMWEKKLCEAGIPAVKIRSFEEWMKEPDTRAAHLIAQVNGLEKSQLGRAVWLDSAKPYAELESCQTLELIPAREAMLPEATDKQISKRPLEGFVLVDFANVIAGPNCGRMFSELGATVYKIDPMHPQHASIVMVAWAAEHGAGKKSIILDMQSEEGKEIMNKMIGKADMVIANKQDAQFERMGLSREALDKINPRVISIQLAGYKGEKSSARNHHPGYDPAIQGATGLMHRFGPEGCPSFHGVASCVDYLCGYLGCWAGLSALYAREQRLDGKGDSAVTSLAAAASLTQLLLQHAPAPASAIGLDATGMNDGERWYKVSDGFLFALGKQNLSEELEALTVEQALAHLQQQNIQAVPVQTCQMLTERHRKTPCKTIRFEERERDDWETEGFAPTWFVFDGESADCPGPTARIGSDAPEILSSLGYTSNEIERLLSAGIVGKTEWAQQPAP